MHSTLRTPQQDRSRDKVERLYEVSVELLVQGGWDAVTVGEVERRSGVGRSTFYLRFSGRESLVEYVKVRFLKSVAEDQAAAFERARALRSQTLDEAVSAAIDAMATIFRAHGAALMRIDRADEVGDGGDAMNVLSEQFRSVLEPLLGNDSSAISAAEFATQFAFSALVLEIQPRETFPIHQRRSWDEFVRELSAALVAYLRNRTATPDSYQ